MRSSLIAVMLLPLLVVTCMYCAAPEPNVAVPVKVAHLGGPLYRVFDVDEIDSIDALHSIESIYRAAESCTGIKRDFAPVRVFFTSKIMVRTENGWSDRNTTGDRFVGMRIWDRPWIYLLRTTDADHLAWTLKHEFVHYLTDLGHPKGDDVLKACGVYRYETGETG